jgi:hypothetical protein
VTTADTEQEKSSIQSVISYYELFRAQMEQSRRSRQAVIRASDRLKLIKKAAKVADTLYALAIKNHKRGGSTEATLMFDAVNRQTYGTKQFRRQVEQLLPNGWVVQHIYRNDEAVGLNAFDPVATIS